MKLFIFSFAFLTSVAFAAQSEEEKKWSAQIALATSVLLDETVIAGYGTDDYFDPIGFGLDLKASYELDGQFSVGFGFHDIAFLEDSFTSAENLTKIWVSAAFVSIEFRGEEAEWQGFGSFELGVSSLDDVDYESASLNNKIYEGGSGTYWSLGGGVRYQLEDDMFIDITYRYRSFGTLERNAALWTSAIKDIDVVTSGFDVSLGVKF